MNDSNKLATRSLELRKKIGLARRRFGLSRTGRANFGETSLKTHEFVARRLSSRQPLYRLTIRAVMCCFCFAPLCLCTVQLTLGSLLARRQRSFEFAKSRYQLPDGERGSLRRCSRRDSVRWQQYIKRLEILSERGLQKNLSVSLGSKDGSHPL